METSNLKTLLRQMADITKGSDVGQFYESKANAAIDVQVIPCSEVLTAEEIDWIKSVLKPKKKECYKNALMLAQHLRCEYIEGQMFFCFGIDHAFNKVCGKYIDITKEFALGDDPTQTEYVAIGEYSYKEAAKVAIATGQFGNVFEYYSMRKA